MAPRTKTKRMSGTSGWKRGNELLKHTRLVAKLNKLLADKGDLIRPGWLIPQLVAKNSPLRYRIKGKNFENNLRVVTAKDS